MYDFWFLDLLSFRDRCIVCLFFRRRKRLLRFLTLRRGCHVNISLAFEKNETPLWCHWRFPFRLVRYTFRWLALPTSPRYKMFFWGIFSSCELNKALLIDFVKRSAKERGRSPKVRKRVRHDLDRSVNREARKPQVEKSKNFQVPQFLISSWHEVDIVENRIRELWLCCNPQGGAVESFSFFMCRVSASTSRKHCQFSFPRVSRHGTMARRSNPRHWAGALNSLVEADQTRFSWQKFGLL